MNDITRFYLNRKQYPTKFAFYTPCCGIDGYTWGFEPMIAAR
jgi:hypothetical protein